ncbi:hypothetical protein RJ640_009684 [Escallonia rubra]|uniref:Reverse transcriptase RNase H-like domain-containing protein n=1 Tax=Escallonia rubra TaxID=112253 RepID=A0AA88RJI4_9ASTE|nr:hypothetical protein RJ640_009684 [Escallonia rubra]
MEKVCLALVFALKELKHYLGEHVICLISRADPLKYIHSRLVLTGRIARSDVILHQFNIEYVPQKVVKGQALIDFLVAHPVLDDSPLVLDLSDEEVMLIEIKKGWEMNLTKHNLKVKIKPRNKNTAAANVPKLVEEEDMEEPLPKYDEEPPTQVNTPTSE